MSSFKRDEGRPSASASFLWEDAESGDLLRVSIQVSDRGHADFFADLEQTGFRRLAALEHEVETDLHRANEEHGENEGDIGHAEMPTTHARRSSNAGTKVEADGGTLLCSIDISSTFHAPASELPLTERTVIGEDQGPVRRESA